MTLHGIIKTVFYRAGFSIKKLRKPSGAISKITPKGRITDIMAALHPVSPYQGFDYCRYPNDPSGWGSDAPVFRELIAEIRPSLIVEAGTWKGASALHMAGLLEELGIDGEIVCIDTWLGALEFWSPQEHPERYAGLEIINGYPSVYYHFLANVCHAGQQKRIIPFPQTSSTGALWLRCHGVEADLIYIDASHEEEDVYSDITQYWEVLRPGGILLGDDWTWGGVRMAAERFARERRLPLHMRSEKWFFRKPH